MIVNILEYEPYEYDMEELRAMQKSISEALPEGSIIIAIPRNVHFRYDTDLSYLTYLREILDEAITDKINRELAL